MKPGTRATDESCMVIKNKCILLLLAASFVANCSFAQKIENKDEGDKYRAVHWGLDEGMSHGQVNAMIKDVNGFLWIATGFGLNRFDGNTFKRYFADKAKKNKTIIGNFIAALIEDSLHNIWIGTDKGVSWYDTRADTFRNISSGIPPSTIVPFWATKNEVFCWDLKEFPFSSPLVAYNIHGFAKRTLAVTNVNDSVGFGVSDQYPIFDAVSNSIWLEYGFQGTAGGLLQISLTDGKRKKFYWDCYRKIPNHGHRSEGTRYDKKRNSIWISSPDGLVEFTLSDRKFHHVDALNELENRKDFWQWAGIDIDPAGRVWGVTYPEGIAIYDPSHNSVELPFPNDAITQKDVSDQNVFLYCDRDGMIWSSFWSDKGIYQLIPFSPAVRRYFGKDDKAHGLTSKHFYNCLPGGQGKLWMTSDEGIYIFDPQTGSFNLLHVRAPTDLKGTDAETFFAINVDTIRKTAWMFGFGAGWFETDLVSGKSSPVLYEESNGNKKPLLSVLAHHPQNANAVPYKNGCIIGADLPDRQEILLVTDGNPIAQKILSFSNERIIDLYGIFSNNDDVLFLKSPNDATNLTYTYHNKKWVLTATSLDSIQWSSICYNQTDETYWIIAETRLIHYDKNFRIIHSYTEDEGMPGVPIHNLVPDKKGNIWFNTDRSIFQLSTATGTITMLTEKDGFISTKDFPDLFRQKDVNGDIYIGRNNAGFDRLNPDKYISKASSVHMESLKINQQPFFLSAGIDHIEQLSLKYFENTIDIETGIIDYYNSKSKGHIRYKLEAEGKSANWQYAPAYSTIHYEGLPPAKYRLVLQSSNAANEFNGIEKILMINISPAFWNTWWFRLIALAFLIDVIYTVIRWRLKQKYNLRLERSESEKQIADVRRKATELEMQALRAQMNPHFIFNSLNSINRFILQNNKAQASEYLTKFSKLVRMILQNSQASLISLEAELEALGLYLEMEALRFNYHFDYKVTTSKDLDIEVLQVPPLILQPYVENAIWHGLMHKEEKGHLNIEVSEKDDHLYFSIEDNGIGRQKAKELASKTATKHKSMGLRITASRIAILQKNGSTESPVTIRDLVDSKGIAAGTEVIIKMPLLYD